MTTIQIIHGNFQIADPDWPRFTPRVPSSVYTSDTFSTDGELVGSTTDVALGGLPMAWEGRTGGWAKSGGALKWVSTGEAVIDMAIPDYEVSFDVVALPTDGQLYIVGRRQSANPIENNHYRLDLRADGRLTMVQAHHGPPSGSTVLGTSPTTVAAGDTVAFRFMGDRLAATVNGVDVITATDSTYLNGGWAGLHSTTRAAGATLDNFTLTAL